MDDIQKLTELFSHFPGIGPRQAKRFVYHLLNQNESINKQTANLIINLKRETRSCSLCNRFFFNQKEGSICNICSDKNRDKERLMIVAKDIDFENIERTKLYEGFYFVLGGLIPVLDKNPSEKIRQRELMSLIQKMDDLKEIIIALSVNIEGDHTTDYLKETLTPFLVERKIKISVLGRGLSTGTELEYSDSATIKNALKNRE